MDKGEGKGVEMEENMKEGGEEEEWGIWGGEEIKEEMGVGEAEGNRGKDRVEWVMMGGTGLITLCPINSPFLQPW